ncbi:Hypothetical_protein [Hexamita inflata]|uniref:Hypothetical_protein n=1 Tax=Hexamita inflata TaxID=28002 RepID=A0AA86TDD8_9EUKA|nr:Hypothetical protein HINF_LOCUS2370 [Hexamita inflata]
MTDQTQKPTLQKALNGLKESLVKIEETKENQIARQVCNSLIDKALEVDKTLQEVIGAKQAIRFSASTLLFALKFNLKEVRNQFTKEDNQLQKILRMSHQVVDDYSVFIKEFIEQSDAGEGCPVNMKSILFLVLTLSVVIFYLAYKVYGPLDKK